MERKGLSGSALKIIAIVTMLIDHIAATVIIRILKFGGYNDGLYQLYRVMRNIGRIAFPIFCFLLVEGFMHTRDREKYALRLGCFAAVSEIPFDLAFNGKVLEVGYQNVFFTLLLGLLTMMAYDVVMNQSRWSVWKRTALSTIAILAGMFAAEFLSTDYGALGVLHYGILPVPEKQNTAGRVWMSGICMVGMGSSVCIRSNLLLQWKTWLWNEIFLLRILSGASADPVSDRI